MKFIKWCFSDEAPEWVIIMSFCAAALLVIFYFMIAIMFLAVGLWVITVVMIVMVPLYMVYRTYLLRR